ncbi:MAG: hypothetical protein IT372_18685 [Polyangiaceae bacterium]|nr:hypothetical protein [Polyangiaceae bacterium]
MSGAASPSASARVVAALVAARVAFGLAYLGGSLRRAPIPWYHPLDRAWSFGSEPGGFAMEWFGRSAAALALGLAAGALCWALAARGAVARALARPEVVLGMARAAGLTMLVDFVYFGWVLMHPTAAPLPLAPCPP